VRWWWWCCCCKEECGKPFDSILRDRVSMAFMDLERRMIAFMLGQRCLLIQWEIQTPHKNAGTDFILVTSDLDSVHASSVRQNR